MKRSPFSLDCLILLLGLVHVGSRQHDLISCIGIWHELNDRSPVWWEPFMGYYRTAHYKNKIETNSNALRLWRILCAIPGSKLTFFFHSTRFILMNLGCVVVNEFADDENPYEPPPIMPSEYLDTFKVLRMCLLCMAQPNLTSFDTFVSRRFSKLRATRNYGVTTKGSYNIIWFCVNSSVSRHTNLVAA